MCITPPLSAQNNNVFGRSVGINFPIPRGDITKTAVRQVSSFKHASMFLYTDEITNKLAERKYWQLLKDATPAHSSAAIVNRVYKRLLILHRSSLDVFEPAEPSSSIDGPTGQTRSRLQSLLPLLVFNTVIGAVIPDETAWKDAYVANPDCRVILHLIANPSLVMKAHLSKIHSSYCSPLRRCLIFLQKSMLLIKGPIRHESAYNACE
jgi:hypothetical protein